MPIQTQSADGMQHEFPDDTPREAVDRAMKTYAEEHRDKSTVLGQVGQGLADPLIGLGQFAAHAAQYVPHLGPGGDEPDAAAKLPAQADQFVNEREAAIRENRGQAAGKMDWSRLAGNVLNPVNYLGGGLVRGAGMAVNAGRAAVGGAAASAMQPTETSKDNFGAKKAEQVALGAVTGGGLGIGGGAVSKGVEKVGEFVARNYPEALENKAVQVILKRAAQDQKSGAPSVKDMIDLVNAAQKPVTLADVGGANVRGLAGNMARKPGDARGMITQFLTKRDEQAAQRLSQDVEKYVHSGSTMHQVTDGLIQARSADSRPMYEAALDLKNIWSPRLQAFIDDPAFKTGLGRGYELERLLALSEGRSISATQLGVDLDTEGNVKLVSVPNMRLLDMAKKGLDAMVADERNEITGRLSQRGVMLDKARRAFVSEMDSLDTTGTYRKARKTWEGYSASLDAVKFGRAALTGDMSPEEIASEVTKMSPAQQEFTRIGVADILKERLLRADLTAADDSKALVKNAWMREKLRPLFKTSAEFDGFMDSVLTERQMFGTKQEILGNSKTAERAMEDMQGLDIDKTGQLAELLAKRHWFAAARSAWKYYRDVGIAPSPEFTKKVAETLFSTALPTDSPVVRKLLGQLEAKTPSPAAGAARGISNVSAASTPGTAIDEQITLRNRRKDNNNE